MIRCYFPLISDGSVSKHHTCQENKVWTEEENSRGPSFFLSPASSPDLLGVHPGGCWTRATPAGIASPLLRLLASLAANASQLLLLVRKQISPPLPAELEPLFASVACLLPAHVHGHVHRVG